MHDIHFQIKTLKSGQQRPHGDHIVDIILTDKSDTSHNLNFVHKLCRGLYPPREGTPIDSEITLEQIAQNKYHFVQKTPYTG